jgi:excisionase family DNA binding protein
MQPASISRETPSLDRLLLKVEEGAYQIGVSRARMYELIASGAIPSLTIGRSKRIPAEALRDWVRSQTAQVAA